MLLSVFIIGYLIIFESKSSEVYDFLNNHSDQITKVYIRQDMTMDCVSTTNKAKIQKLVRLLANRHYIKSKNQDEWAGCDFYIDFYIGKSKAYDITVAGVKVAVRIAISEGNNGYSKNYYTDKPISLTAIDKWFHSLPVTKWPSSAK